MSHDDVALHNSNQNLKSSKRARAYSTKFILPDQAIEANGDIIKKALIRKTLNNSNSYKAPNITCPGSLKV